MAGPGIETELKFQVPRGRRGALRAAVGTAGARTTRLQALYADTAGSHLAAAGMALRLRKEGRVWVQTLKGRGDGLAARFEHEVQLPLASGLPELDAHRHDGTALASALQRALHAGGPLLPVYRTDIRRLHRRLRFQGAVVELALDRGHLLAGERRLAVHEIEFELISGPPDALPRLAAQWALRFGLWWDVRTKSEQGFRLAHGLMSIPTAQHATTASAAHAGGDGGLASRLAQVMPAAAELAGGTGSPSHLTSLLKALQALAREVSAADPAAAATAQRVLADLQDIHTAPAVVRSAPFTALMLHLLQRQWAAAPLPPQRAAAPR